MVSDIIVKQSTLVSSKILTLFILRIKKYFPSLFWLASNHFPSQKSWWTESVCSIDNTRPNFTELKQILCVARLLTVAGLWWFYLAQWDLDRHLNPAGKAESFGRSCKSNSGWLNISAFLSGTLLGYHLSPSCYFSL